MKVKESVEIIQNELKIDEGYYYAWQSNIAMSFYDEMQKSGIHSPNPDNHIILVTNELLHKITNQAAMNFLDTFVSKYNNN